MKRFVYAAALFLGASALFSPVSSHAQAAPLPSAADQALVHEGKQEVNGVRYHYLIARGGPQVIVLLHGWGSTSYMWRYVMPALAHRGYTVLAPDLRGLGDTSRPATGYEKATIAQDIHALVAALKLGPDVSVVGHDMGGMVAYAYASQYPTETRTFTIMDVPLPGIDPWDKLVGTDRVWHFHFFGQRDVAELLVQDHVAEFLPWFHNNEAVNAGAFTKEVDDYYVRKYSMPGALRAGFEYYRAFGQDAKDNAVFSRTPLTMPVLALGGTGSFGPLIGDQMSHVATHVRTVQIENAGHWIAEEQPDQVIAALVSFLPSARK